MNRIQSIQYLSWLLIALMLSPLAQAGNKDENDIPWYQVEIIIFANQNQDGIMSETWPDPPEIKNPTFLELTHPDDAATVMANTKSELPKLSANPNSVMPTPYELLRTEELQLTPVAKKLEKSSNYQPIVHMGWRQPTLHPDDSTPIFIYQGVELPLITDPGVTSQPATAKTNAGGSRFSSVAVGNFTVDSSQYGQLMSPSEIDTLTGPEFNPFYGTLRLSVSRYLHLEANLNYRIPVIKQEVVPVSMEDSFVSSGFQQNVAFTEEGEIAETKLQERETIQNLNMFETRRMRSKEIHYFDHPSIGIIVRVIPYEIPENEPDFDPASQAFTSGNGKPKVESPQ